MSIGGWNGIRVKREDHIEGIISNDYVGFLHRNLTLTWEDGREGSIELNTNGKDQGDLGVHWWCEHFSEGARWLVLGDHNTPNLIQAALQDKPQTPPGARSRRGNSP